MFYLCVKIQRQVQGGGVHQRVASKEEKEERQLFADKFQPSSGEQEDNSPDKVSSSAERSSLIMFFLQFSDCEFLHGCIVFSAFVFK